MTEQPDCKVFQKDRAVTGTKPEEFASIRRPTADMAAALRHRIRTQARSHPCNRVKLKCRISAVHVQLIAKRT
jgi:hypothetical protein